MPGERHFDRYEIRDQGLFRKLVTKLQKEHGSGSKAAAAIGVSQPTFWRLQQVKRSDTVTHANMAKLALALIQVSPGLNHDLGRCVMGTAGKRLWHSIYLPWCKERTKRFARRRGAHWHRTMETPPRMYRAGDRWHVEGREQLLQMTLRWMAQDCPGIWKRGQAKLRSTGASFARVKVALARIAEPLSEYADSGYVELTWRQLAPPDQKAYLRRAFDQEFLLLPRPHDQDKAREVAERVRIQWSKARSTAAKRVPAIRIDGRGVIRANTSSVPRIVPE
jgi:hypothetical protein